MVQCITYRCYKESASGLRTSGPYLAAPLIRSLTIDSTAALIQQRYCLNITNTNPAPLHYLHQRSRIWLEDCWFVSQGHQIGRFIYRRSVYADETTLYCISSYQESHRLHGKHSFIYPRQRRRRGRELTHREEDRVDKQY